jgi:hypothetical protein
MKPSERINEIFNEYALKNTMSKELCRYSSILKYLDEAYFPLYEFNNGKIKELCKCGCEKLLKDCKIGLQNKG